MKKANEFSTDTGVGSVGAALVLLISLKMRPELEDAQMKSRRAFFLSSLHFINSISMFIKAPRNKIWDVRMAFIFLLPRRYVARQKTISCRGNNVGKRFHPFDRINIPPRGL